MSKRRGRPKKQKAYEIETVNVDNADFEVEAETSCFICYAEFIDPEDLQIHISAVHENQHIIEKCGFCASNFKCLDALAVHIRDEHLTSLLLCSYCFRVFIDANEFRLHKKLHVNNSKAEPYSCSNCKATFEYIKDLENHELEYHFDSESGVFIHKCFSLLSSYVNLNIVAFLQSLCSETVYVCKNCHYSNKSAEQYIEHLKKSKCQSCACDNCNNVYSKLKYLLQHIKTNKECMHSPSDHALTVKCGQCQNYIRKEIYVEHKNSCKVVSCQICQKTFDSMDQFTAHQTDVHAMSIEIFICRYCQRQYAGDAVLQKHIDRVHQRELHLYKYSCAECDNTFKHPKLLFNHYNSRHPEMKPFTCKICERSFKQRKKFTIHIKVHHNGKGKVKLAENSHIYFMEKSSEVDNIIEMPDNNMLETEDNSIIQIEQQGITEEEAPTEMTMDNNIEEATTEKPQTSCTDTSILPTNRSSKRKRKLRTRNSTDSRDSDEEPLTKKVTRKALRWNKHSSRLKTVPITKDKKNFTCPQCKKYCYTFQNYKRHMSLHAENISLKCIKCDEKFKSEKALNKHVSDKHSYSKLTETLKSVLEKRKNRNEETSNAKSDLNRQKFYKTIKKVNIVKSNESAILTEVKTGLSKFIETFTPEILKPNKKAIKICTNISIKTVTEATRRPPLIKMHKFKPPPPKNGNSKPLKLAMPTKCKLPSTTNQPSAKIKVVTSDNVPKFSLKINKMGYNSTEKPDLPNSDVLLEAVNEDHAYAHTDTQDYEDDEDLPPVIPEVAEEVMLAASEDAPKQKFTHKLILPNIPAAFAGIRIGHLLPEAPYYKIIHVKDLIDDEGLNKDNEVKEEEPVTLPFGTKLVNVNPLEHLLKDTSILQNEKPKNTKDYSAAVAKALLKLEQKTSERSVKKPKVIKAKPKTPVNKAKLTKLAQNLRMLTEGVKVTPKKKVNELKKSNKRHVEEDTQLRIVENQETNEELDMEVMEEYLEDLPSDEEVIETMEARKSDPKNSEVEEIPEGNKEVLSLPEL